MTANEMIPAVGQTVELNADGLWFACTVADVKFSWGKPRLLVRPVTGSGERWVELSSIRPSRVPRYQVIADHRDRAPQWIPVNLPLSPARLR